MTALGKCYPYTFDVIDASRFDEMLSGIHTDGPFVIYGAGDCGRKCYAHLLHKNIPVNCFVDRNDYWQQEQPYFTQVLSFESFRERYAGETVLIASYKEHVCQEIRASLEGIVEKGKILIVPTKKIEVVLQLPGAYQEDRASELDYAAQPACSPPVTVVSIIYNTPAQYLRRAIESVLAQSFRDFEYLIIDHASDDGATASIIGEYAQLDKRIRVVRTEKNYINALHRGLEKDVSKLYQVLKDNLHSEYACVLDSDDCFAQDYLSEAYASIQRNGADTYFVAALSYDEDGLAENRLWASCNLPPEDRSAKLTVEKFYLFANAYHAIGGWGMLTKSELLLRGYQSAWVGTAQTSDLKVGYQVMLSSKQSVYSGKICIFYVNRANAITSVLKSKVSGRLDITINLCLKKHLSGLKSILKTGQIDSDLALYHYAEYFLMVLLQYLGEVSQSGVSDDCRQEVYERMRALQSDSYLMRVVDSQNWLRNEFDRLLHVFQNLSGLPV